MRASDRGTPQWLLKLLTLAAVTPCVLKASLNASLVPVLPTLPVTATIRARLRARPARPRAHSASMVSATSTSGASSATSSGRVETIAAAAPLGQRPGNETMPVGVGTDKRHEQITRLHRPTVDRHAICRPVRATGLSGDRIDDIVPCPQRRLS